MPEITIETHQTGPTDPAADQQGSGEQGQQQQENQGGSGGEIPAKFQNEDGSVNTEALLQSYRELERAQSADNGSGSEEGSQGQSQGQGEGSSEEGGSESGEGGEENSTFQPFFDEFSEKGELTEESLGKLKEMGVTKEMVDQFIAGAQASANEINDTVVAEVGTREDFDAMAAWAKEATDPKVKETVETFNKAMREGEATTARLAAQALNAAHRKATGKQPARRVSGEAQSAAPQGFQSHAQMMEAIASEKYAKDPAFRADVEKRIAASDRSKW